MTELDESLIRLLESEGYFNLKFIQGRGVCGLRKFMFTVGLCYGIDSIGFDGRYCYPHEYQNDAVVGLEIWDGKDDPIGNWVKHKGLSGEYGNVNLTIKS